MTRRERLEAKAERRRDWAQSAKRRAEASFGAAGTLADQIPLGQPILVGHHSERRARRDAERIRDRMDRGCQEQRKAEHHIGRAHGLEVQLARSVFSDDEDAIERLEERIAKTEMEAERAQAINRAWRKAKGDPAQLAESGLVSRALAEAMAETMRQCPWLKSPVDTTNLRASIRRDRQRIEEIRQRQARAAQAEESGGVAIEESGSWVRITFSEKPEREVLEALRSAGFHWGRGSWSGPRESIPARLLEEVTR
uniref:DUF3560 domain-containing protein n=1 Tax=viral metagenome TaxID=1070528 RepID=A0A6M3M474_9ZZZZ